MFSDEDRYRIARQAEEQHGAIVCDLEAELGTNLERLKDVRYTIDRHGRLSQTGQEPYHRLFPRLTSKPYWSLTDFQEDLAGVLQEFDAQGETLRDEFIAALDRDRFQHGVTGYFGASEQWRHHVVLNDKGEFVADVQEQFPTLSVLLLRLATLYAVRKSYFALLRPGGELKNHCGGTNLLLRMHLGLVIPPGDTGLTVGGITCRWAQGKALFFDDSFGHEAWNRTDRDRYILLLRLVHPDLTGPERACLPVIHQRFAATRACREVAAVLQELMGQGMAM